ncbi:molybdate ABC transporter substrate-binding protein [Actinomyces sp. 594]|uniref:molybdate ABC transporter substrate-binding protein n=1 Tax=Actinomyces sp. 594 TaxID=2057793 RepID=UPI001C594A95|nr:molybdate ABC transporter substrate-binding protein [Actinomyces sp. 594]MBW3069901.1 molybdate ABC transporter substrate-binding protein [Actinomyces sp. 594]
MHLSRRRASATRRTALATAVLTAALSLTACGAIGSPSSSTESPNATATNAGANDQVVVFAAASLQDAFEEIADDFQRANLGVSVVFDFQGSQDLVSALSEGAAADVLATANNSTMDDAAAQSLVADQSEFATNVLTLIVPAGNPAGVTGIDDGTLDGADLVICAPEVPCGEATRTLATRLGVTLDPVSEEQKVTDVRGKVASGEADAGIVYTTDAADAGNAVEVIALPDNDVVNHYPIALTRDTAVPDTAQAFVDLVLSDAGQAVLAKYGFGAPAAK